MEGGVLIERVDQRLGSSTWVFNGSKERGGGYPILSRGREVPVADVEYLRKSHSQRRRSIRSFEGRECSCVSFSQLQKAIRWERPGVLRVMKRGGGGDSVLPVLSIRRGEKKDAIGGD